MPKDTSVVEGSPEEEAAETPDEETQEGEETQEDDTTTKGGVKVPESFQQEVSSLVEGKTQAQLSFIMDAVNEQRKKLMSSQKKNKLNTNDFSAVDMPSSY